MANLKFGRGGTFAALTAATAGVGYLFWRNRDSLGFRGRLYSLKSVQDIMTRDPKFCLRDTPIGEVARLMVLSNCGEIPVVDSTENRRPIGVITDRDIVCRLVGQSINPLDRRAGDCMSTPPVTVRFNSPARDCVRLMEENQIRRIPVVDDQGKLYGIVSHSDIARTLSRATAGRIIESVSEVPPRAPHIAA